MIDWLNGLYAAPSPKEEHEGKEVNSAPKGDARLRRLEKAQAWSMMGCSPLEAVCESSLVFLLQQRAGWIGED